MSRTIQDFWPIFTAEQQLPGNVSQDEATDLLQVEGPLITDVEGDAWFVAVATYYESTGIIVQPTYVALRNYVNNNEAGANLLFSGLNEALQNLPESVVIEEKFQIQDDAVILGGIPASIAIVEGNKAATTDELLRAAYDEAIKFLTAAEAALTP